ncbi:hypothetical protein [Chenggangzhangella methanolivorans]|uniref:Fibronectin type-III domain-containing protein n=1 Tax=Chenggangzhangella methanolivorans TaxID=1437009 RepID=A0A9E6RBH9_9HYPH|nr:hypothetical protein [Chenggangzhangella methanolivorans]QZO01315.1 hypothetical protein K6K41_07410 [Chenggangzhangella methanolivorans]
MRTAALVLFCAALAGPARAEGLSAGGMTADQHERQTPQPPRDLVAARLGDGSVEIRWRPPPPPPGGPLMYERSFSAYRVYRLDGGGGRRLVAETRELRAVDPAPPAGASYVVVTLQPSGREGARPDAVAP